MELEKQEKIDIINIHIKNVVNNIFNLNMLVIQESAVTPINQDAVDALELQLENAFAKRQALQNELEKVINEPGE